MDAEFYIFKKLDEAVVLCSSPDCDKAKSDIGTLTGKGYEEVTSLPKPIHFDLANSRLQFSVRAEDDVEVRPPSCILEMDHVKPGRPHPITFRFFSASGQDSSVQLVVKEGETDVDQEDFEVICKKKEIKIPAVPAVPGGGKAAFMTGGKVDNLQMNGAKVDIVGNMTNYAPTEHRYQGDFKCDKRQTRNAQFMAEGVMNLNQKGVTNIQHVGKR